MMRTPPEKHYGPPFGRASFAAIPDGGSAWVGVAPLRGMALAAESFFPPSDCTEALGQGYLVAFFVGRRLGGGISECQMRKGYRESGTGDKQEEHQGASPGCSSCCSAALPP